MKIKKLNYVCVLSYFVLTVYILPSGRLHAGIVGSNPTRGMDVCLLWVLYAIR